MRLFTIAVLFLTSACSSTEKTEVADADFDGFSEVEDCDDSDAGVYPGAIDTVGDGIDQNCDSIDGVDADSDGLADVASGGIDCDDSNPEEEASAMQVFYQDADGDGYGNPNLPQDACDMPTGTVDNGEDCDDGSDAISPDAAEVCDEQDNDCDGAIDEEDEDLEGGLTFYADMDGDGYGDAGNASTLCFPMDGYVENDEDCDDSSATISPAAEELTASGVDEDCNGEEICYIDADNDGFGSAELGSILGTDCDIEGFSTSGDDCDDVNTEVHPLATEICDQFDNDCDGLLDEADDNWDDSSGTIFYADADGDGYGDAATILTACLQPDASSINSEDCDDSLPKAYPGAAYNDSTTECMHDFDGDGYGDTSATSAAPGSDCNDMSGSVNPLATDIVGDGIDQNCDGIDGTDSDGDGYASTASGGNDCDDNEASVFVGATESYYDGIDQNCDGLSDFDQDGDGFDSSDYSGDDCDDDDDTINVDASETYYDGIDQNCDGLSDFDQDGDGFDSSDYSGDDCDDENTAINTAATEVCDSLDNNCDGTVDEGLELTLYADADGDGYGDASAMITSCEQDAGFVSDATDCDDDSASTYPGAASMDSTEECMSDGDGDGYGDASAVLPVTAGSDCNDSSSYLNPSATDVYGDDIDQNCDGFDGVDTDGDGDPAIFSGGSDCDDGDATLQGLDTDGDGYSTCDGDCDDTDATTMGDDDGDGYRSCDVVPDCDDGDASVNPDASEVYYDGVDQNCDGLSDFDRDGDGEDIAELDCDADGLYDVSCDLDGDGNDDFTSGTDCDDDSTFYNTADADGDGYSTCADSSGLHDCDDDDGFAFPGAGEIDSTTECLRDADEDGYGDVDYYAENCVVLELFDTFGDAWDTGATLELEDSSGVIIETYDFTSADDCTAVDENLGLCSTTSGGTSGGEPETYKSFAVCTNEQSDVSLVYTEGGTYNSENGVRITSGSETYEFGSRFSDSSGVALSEMVSGTLFSFQGFLMGSDCNDSDASILATDIDLDGYVSCVDDCDDSDAAVNPGATEVYYDGVDQDCLADDDFDQDGDGEAIYQLDCDGDGSFETECDLDGDGTVDYIGGLDLYDTDPDRIDVLALGDDCVDDEDCDSGYCGRSTDTCASLSTIYISALNSHMTGNLGGLDGADSMCASQADAYGYTGTWVALLSTSTVDAISRIPDITLSDGSDLWDLAVYTVYGENLISSWESLASNSETSVSHIVRSFNGNQIEEFNGFSNDADVWTGSDGLGYYYSGQSCSDWTTTSGLGVATEADGYQIFRVESGKSCSTSYAVQCVKVED